eukprot:CAMPEP_0197642794 /NCGR_PEP_ID=MMETSP1338-20131121/16345_1 /TAXON_ID=43686 ORGANISM="Pelagodinium beii, Strain RCC1491" /NCGR_SAMPLE_ID=MMETSP1338 /ASSEMBLY_ACC=CAM_ASM_000754 /LENGTH=329 /DNA_ID=CAMNT_0043215967 /DNA_START=97 /DNA_END=1086 /DNA_ORIENTATION=+
MYLINLMETLAFTMIAYDAKKKRTHQISAQTMVGLTVSLALTIFNMPSKFEAKVFKACLITVGTVFGCVASKEVAKTTQVKGEDDLGIPGLPEWTGKAMIYMATLVAGCIALLVACKGSIFDTVGFVISDIQSTTCTFQNFLHAFALVPQLLVCRRQGFVSPAAVRFLFLIGVKHLYEFTSDAWISYKHYLVGKLELHEFSFMSGDFVAAIILLDFLYMVAVDQKNYLLCTGELELELAGDEEAGTPEKRSERVPANVFAQLQSMWSNEKQRKQLVFFAAVVTLAALGVAFELINVWVMAGAGLLYVGGRKVFSVPLLPVSEKVEKCVV